MKSLGQDYLTHWENAKDEKEDAMNGGLIPRLKSEMMLERAIAAELSTILSRALSERLAKKIMRILTSYA